MELKIKFGQGELVLRKSGRYVGIKRNKTRGIESTAVNADISKIEKPYLGGFEMVGLKLKKGETVNSKLDVLRKLDGVETGTHVYFGLGSKKPLIPTGSIYITFQPEIPETRQTEILNTLNLQLKSRRAPNKIVASVTPSSENPIKCAIALQAMKEILRAEPDMDAEVDHYILPGAQYWSQMWHLKNNGSIPDSPTIQIKRGADSKVFEAWQLLDGYGNPSIKVAIIDNGIDIKHQDLRDKVVNPYDCWNHNSNLITGDPAYTHGTPCASVAIATSDVGMVGAAPVARFMPISGTGFSIENTEEMFNYAMNHGADVISCSWGTTESGFTLGPDKMDVITKTARSGRNGKGCVICFAAGNENVDYVNYYGAIPDVICVAASTSEDEHPDYSNRGQQVTICAPSNGGFYPVFAARASWDNHASYYGDDIDRGPLYQHFGGTSSATPLVAGICALILSANPNLRSSEVKDILIQTADKIGDGYDSSGHSLQFGYGKINAQRAVQEAMNRANGSATPTPQPTPVTPTPQPNGGDSGFNDNSSQPGG